MGRSGEVPKEVIKYLEALNVLSQGYLGETETLEDQKMPLSEDLENHGDAVGKMPVKR